MFSEKLQVYAEEKYRRRIPLLGEIGAIVEEKLSRCTLDEQILMKYFYGTMPLRDAGEYEFEVFLGFVRHSLMVWRTMEWCKGISEEIFLHHILYYRINSENIEDCRRFFYDELIGRIKGKTVREAVLEINYWCAENGAYEASDNRTISPMTLYRSGKGRCGEESTFAVTAFRSVGIPARQVYTPRWAHCDDNHAWVEVYVLGKWHFLGACEPEEILDKGWFTNASSRALLVHTRNFSDYENGSGEPCIGRAGGIWFYNVTPTYAKTKWLGIRVEDMAGKAVDRAEVSVEVLNSGEYSSIAELSTDAEGRTKIQIGLGTVHLRVLKGDAGGEAIVNTTVQTEITIALKERWFAEKQGEWVDSDMAAPADYPMHPAVLTREQKEINRKRLQRANELRLERIEKYYREDAAKRYPKERELLRLAAGNFEEIYRFLDKDDNPDRKALLHSLSAKDYKDAKGAVLESHMVCAGKYRDVWEKRGELDIYIEYILCPRISIEEMTDYRPYIEEYFSGQAQLGDRLEAHQRDCQAYLSESSKNRHSDCRACLDESLENRCLDCQTYLSESSENRHLDCQAYLGESSEERHIDYQAYLDESSENRCLDRQTYLSESAEARHSDCQVYLGESAEDTYLGNQKKVGVARNPFAIWEYLEQMIHYDENEDYSVVPSPPVCTLKLRFGNPVSQRILFVAICRTLGIPARMNPVNGEAEVYLGERFVQVTGRNVKGTEEKAGIVLRKRENQNLRYYQTWTIAKFENGNFVTLNYEGLRFVQDEIRLKVEPGFYCIRTTNRLPSGNQQASEYRFWLKKGQTAEIEMRIRSGRPEQLLVDYPLEDFEVSDGGEKVMMSSLIGRDVNVLAFLDEGQEPTEHVLNEMMDHGEELGKADLGVYFIFKDKGAMENGTVRKVLEKLSGNSTIRECEEKLPGNGTARECEEKLSGNGTVRECVEKMPEIRVLYGELDEIVEPLARRMYVDPDKLPLLILVKSGLTGVYACSGYHVGSVGMLLKLAQIDRERKI